MVDQQSARKLVAKLDLWQRAYAMSQHCAARMLRLRATGMAAELTYRTIFALIPLTVLGLVLFRVVGGLESIQAKVEDQLFSFFGVPDVAYPEVTVPEPEVPEIPPPEPEPEESATSPIATAQLRMPRIFSAALIENEPIPFAQLAASKVLAEDQDPTSIKTSDRNQKRENDASIRQTLKDLTAKVTGLDFASIGVVGLLLFIYAAVGLTDSVEADFNLVCESKQHRPLHLRMAIHWSILTFGSGLLAMSLYLSDALVHWLAGHNTIGLAPPLLSRILSFLSGWFLLFLLYALMPNTRIQPRAAIVGSLVAALLWELAKRCFHIYFATTQPYANLYGSLGLIPVFLFWIYVTWLIVLFGLFLTYSYQAYPGHLPTPEEDRLAADLVPNSLWAVSALAEIGVAFEKGQALDLPVLTDRLRLPSAVVRTLVEALEKAGLVMRTIKSGTERIVLARPAERIRVSDVLYDLSVPPSPAAGDSPTGWSAYQRIQQSLRQSAQSLTLAELLEPKRS
jgi:membrane protein